MRDWRVGRHAAIQEEAPPGGALAPRGASLEAGSPSPSGGGPTSGRRRSLSSTSKRRPISGRERATFPGMSSSRSTRRWSGPSASS
jgi:hypothetical protein